MNRTSIFVLGAITVGLVGCGASEDNGPETAFSSACNQILPKSHPIVEKMTPELNQAICPCAYKGLNPMTNQDSLSKMEELIEVLEKRNAHSILALRASIFEAWRGSFGGLWALGVAQAVQKEMGNNKEPKPDTESEEEICYAVLTITLGMVPIPEKRKRR